MQNLDLCKETAIAAALAGGKVLLDKFSTPLKIEHKGEIDLVTEADREAEATIVSLIRRTFPDHNILGEEGEYEHRNNQHCWIIDPLDGTTNFAHGFPWFAVSIGLEIDRAIALGVVYNPYFKELYVAQRHAGAFLNGERLHVSKTERLDRSLLATGFPYDRKVSDVNNYDHFVNFQNAAQACRRPGAASLDLAAVAAGRFDGYWEMKLKPWDAAAGKLLVEEAGGRMTDFDGRPFDLYRPECLASNGLIHEAMQEVLKGGRRP